MKNMKKTVVKVLTRMGIRVKVRTMIRRGDNYVNRLLDKFDEQGIQYEAKRHIAYGDLYEIEVFNLPEG